MDYKIFRRNNYIVVTDENNVHYTGFAKNVLVNKTSESSTNFFFKGIEKFSDIVPLANIKTEAGGAYTEQEWEDFYTLNTGFNTPQVGGERLYRGVIDYNDTSTTTTPIELNSGNANLSTWVNLPNDGLGAYSLNTVVGVSDIIDTTDGKYDFSELKQGDLVDLRIDLRVTTNTPNVLVKARILLGGVHANAFPIEFAHRYYDSQLTDDVFIASTKIDLQEPFLFTDKSILQVWADKDTTIKNLGVRNWLHL
ncbi:hypothetical protein [Polaribacter sp.]|uniref:hypothetical protein n=1 Tax=Polaribacter sp. TaxID=1920175 RepID=UPI003F6CB2D0